MAGRHDHIVFMSALMGEVDKLADQVIQVETSWRRTLLVHPTIACRSAVEVAKSRPDQFETFHKQFRYVLADGEEIDGPTMHVEVVIDEDNKKKEGIDRDMNCVYINSMRMDVKMCNECASVARGMKCCNRCEQAWYCSRACQRRAWPLHKAECNKYKSVLEHHETSAAKIGRPRRLVVKSLREVLLPGRSHLCRFWLAAFISAIPDSRLEDIKVALEPLVVYLWKYTWAAMPEPLRPKFIAAMHSVKQRMLVSMADGEVLLFKPPGTGGAKTRRGSGVEAHLTITWLLEGDEEYREWCRGRPESQCLPDRLLTIQADQQADPSVDPVKRVARTFIAKAVLEQDGMQLWMPTALMQQVHYEVMVLRGGLCARGAGLLASPFGALAAPDACVRIIRRYTSFALGNAPLETVQQHAVPIWYMSRCTPVLRQTRDLSQNEQALGYLRMRENSDVGLGTKGEAEAATTWDLTGSIEELRLHGCGALPVEAACTVPREARPFKDASNAFLWVLEGGLLSNVATLRLSREWQTGWSHSEIGLATGPAADGARKLSVRLPDLQIPER